MKILDKRKHIDTDTDSEYLFERNRAKFFSIVTFKNFCRHNIFKSDDDDNVIDNCIVAVFISLVGIVVCFCTVTIIVEVLYTQQKGIIYSESCSNITGEFFECQYGVFFESTKTTKDFKRVSKNKLNKGDEIWIGCNNTCEFNTQKNVPHPTCIWLRKWLMISSIMLACWCVICYLRFIYNFNKQLQKPINESI